MRRVKLFLLTDQILNFENAVVEITYETIIIICKKNNKTTIKYYNWKDVERIEEEAYD